MSRVKNTVKIIQKFKVHVFAGMKSVKLNCGFSFEGSPVTVSEDFITQWNNSLAHKTLTFRSAVVWVHIHA